MKGRGLQNVNVTLVWKLPAKKACPNWNITSYQEPKVLRFFYKELKIEVIRRLFEIELVSILSLVTAVYDLTVGFKKTAAEPTLLSIIKGRCCKAEMFVR